MIKLVKSVAKDQSTKLHWGVIVCDYLAKNVRVQAVPLSKHGIETSFLNFLDCILVLSLLVDDNLVPAHEINHIKYLFLFILKIIASGLNLVGHELKELIDVKSIKLGVELWIYYKLFENLWFHRNTLCVVYVF